MAVQFSGKEYYKSVYGCNEAYWLLYRLLEEREKTENISHKKMPSYLDHVLYVNNKPHREWWLIYSADTCVGQLYLTSKNEIGIQIFEEFRRRGYAKKAISFVMANYHKIDLIANINPNNVASIALFTKFGFKVCQHTYKRDGT